MDSTRLVDLWTKAGEYIANNTHTGWQVPLPCCQRTPTYLRNSPAPQLANVQVMAGLQWP